MSKKIIIIGSAFSALAASMLFSKKQGHNVTISQNPTIGGRTTQLIKDGFLLILVPPVLRL
jgi:phytoene desaturase